MGHRGACCDLCQRVFSPRSFIASGLTFRSLIHSEFIFVYGVRKWSSFILFQVPHPLLSLFWTHQPVWICQNATQTTSPHEFTTLQWLLSQNKIPQSFQGSIGLCTTWLTSPPYLTTLLTSPTYLTPLLLSPPHPLSLRHPWPPISQAHSSSGTCNCSHSTQEVSSPPWALIQMPPSQLWLADTP